MDSFFDGAFPGGFGVVTAVAMGFPLTTLTLEQTMTIGGISSAFSASLSYLGDRYIKGEMISTKEFIIGTIQAGIMGAAFSGILYSLSKGFNALRKWWNGRSKQKIVLYIKCNK